MFVGKRNQRADPYKFDRAEDMFEKGESPEKIYAETGIYYGRDSQPRQEFSDLGMVNEEVLDRAIKAAIEAPNAQDSIMFKSLFPDESFQAMFVSDRGYPSINLMSAREGKSDLATRGYYRPSDHSIYINPYQVSMDSPSGVEPTSVQDAASFLLHELQHGIQRTDNLTSGTSPDDAMRKYNQFALDVQVSPVVKEAEAKLSQMNQPRSELRDVNQADLSKFFQGISISDSATRMAKYVLNDPVYQKNQNEIMSQLGMLPKKPLSKRNAWLNKAAEIVAQKYADSVQTKELLDMDRRQLKNLSNRLYRKSYPSDSYETASLLSASDKIFRDANQLFMNRGDTDFKAYQRKLGEQEARAVQDRRNMTQQELEARFPEKDYSNPAQSWLDRVPTTPRGLLNLTRDR